MQDWTPASLSILNQFILCSQLVQEYSSCLVSFITTIDDWFTYTKSVILELSYPSQQLHLPTHVLNRIAALGIAASTHRGFKPTQRSKQGGSKKQRRIEIVTNRRPSRPLEAERPPASLVHVPVGMATYTTST